MENVGILFLQSWAGISEQPVSIIGETEKRFRIQGIQTETRLPGRMRILLRGQTALVPKEAIRVLSSKQEIRDALSRQG